MNRLFKQNKSVVAAVVLCFMLNMIFPWVHAAPVQASTSLDELACTAIRNNYALYRQGNIDFYDAYILTAAGANLAGWQKEGHNLKTDIMVKVNETLASPDINAISGKVMAQQYLAAYGCGETEAAQQLLNIIKSRQNTNGNGAIDNNAFGDIAAFELLGRVGALDQLDAKATISYILSQQDAATAAWTNTWNDVMCTAEALRALHYLLPNAGEQSAAVQDALTNGIKWLKSLQQEDGSFQDSGGWDDKAVDTAEVITTLKLSGIDPAGWCLENGKSPLDYMLNDVLNEDGTFGSARNSTDNTWVLDAYLAMGAVVADTTVLGIELNPGAATINKQETQQYQARVCLLNGNWNDISSSAVWSSSDSTIAAIDPTGLATGLQAGDCNISSSYQGLNASVPLKVNAGSGSDPQQDYITAAVEVVGKDGHVIFSSDAVPINKSNPFGLTAMAALDATGLEWKFKDGSTSFIIQIAGEANQGLSGWMYNVNGITPYLSVTDQTIQPGDRIMFWYSTDPDSNGPTQIKPQIPEDVNNMLKASLDSYANTLKTLNNGSQIINPENRITSAEAEVLQKSLAENKVGLSQNAGEKEFVMGDQEVSLLIPEKALSQNETITVTELASQETPVEFASKVNSSVYEFGPDGTKFDKPVTISLKIPVTEDMDISRLAAAWYDEKDNKWVSIPALIDCKNNVVVFQIDHFTKFAIIETPVRSGFADVGEDLAWAREAIEVLAGKEIIKGTDTGFEPQKALSRAEFVQLISQAMGLKNDSNKAPEFSDVKTGDWFADAVGKASSNHIITGYPDGSFRPDEPISRSEMAVVLYYLNKNTVKNYKDVQIADIDTIPAWAVNAVRWAFNESLMTGYSDGRFGGDKNLTRAEAAVIVYRYLNSTDSNI